MKATFKLTPGGDIIAERDIDVLPHRGMTVVLGPEQWLRVVWEPTLDLSGAEPEVIIEVDQLWAPGVSPIDRWFKPPEPA